MFKYCYIIIIGLIISNVFGIIFLVPTVLFLFVGTLSQIISRKQYIRKHKNIKKSLSFSFKSMKKTKREFKAINSLTFLPNNQRLFLKKLSILADNLFVTYKKIENQNFYENPGYSFSIFNFFYDRRHH